MSQTEHKEKSVSDEAERTSGALNPVNPSESNIMLMLRYEIVSGASEGAKEADGIAPTCTPARTGKSLTFIQTHGGRRGGRSFI